MLREYEKIFGGRHKTFSQNKIDSRKKEIIIIREIEMMCVCGGGVSVCGRVKIKLITKRHFQKEDNMVEFTKLQFAILKHFFFPFQI